MLRKVKRWLQETIVTKNHRYPCKEHNCVHTYCNWSDDDTFSFLYEIEEIDIRDKENITFSVKSEMILWFINIRVLFISPFYL